MSWVITKKDIPEISLGAKFLSCGGGGDTKTVEYLLLSIMKDTDMIVVKTFMDIMNEWIVPVAVAGSTILYSEDLPSGTEIGQTLKLYEEVTGSNADAVISIEIGGMNGLVPLVAALERNLPVIDGDGMGRAFPLLEMTSFFHTQTSYIPFVALSGEETIIVRDHHGFEEKYQSFLSENYGFMHIACYGMYGQHMKAAMIPGTLKLASEIGKAIGSGSIEDKGQSLRTLFSNSVYGNLEVIFKGRISAIKRWFAKEVLVGSCHLDGQGSFHGQLADVYYQNEFLSIRLSRETCITAPNLIIFVHHETWLPVSVSEIREGILVNVLTVPVPSIFLTKEMRRLTGPQNFDIPNEFIKKGGVLFDEDWD